MTFSLLLFSLSLRSTYLTRPSHPAIYFRLIITRLVEGDRIYDMTPASPIYIPCLERRARNWSCSLSIFRPFFLPSEKTLTLFQTVQKHFSILFFMKNKPCIARVFILLFSYLREKRLFLFYWILLIFSNLLEGIFSFSVFFFWSGLGHWVTGSSSVSNKTTATG